MPTLLADILRGLACAGVGVCLWLMSANRILLLWPDGRKKKTVIAAVFLAVVVIPAFFAFLVPWNGWWLAAGLLGLLLAGGEVRRFWIRRACRAEAPVSSARLFPEAGNGPVTTRDLRLLRYEVQTPLLTSQPVRVALIADLHVSDALPIEHFQQALDAVRAESPDLVLLAGDHAAEQRHASLLARILEGLPDAPLGTFAVLGNHDYWAGPEPIREALRAGGVRLLSGTGLRIPLASGQYLRLYGSEHPWGPGLDPAALAPDGDFVLVLTHTPDNIYSLARPGVASVFAGHYHAGQYRLPGIGPLVVPSVYGRRFDSGHFRVNGVHLFVPSGIGASNPPVRLWCPPEVAIVEFVGRQGRKPIG